MTVRTALLAPWRHILVLAAISSLACSLLPVRVQAAANTVATVKSLSCNPHPCSTLLYVGTQKYESASIVPALVEGDDLNSGASQVATLRFTTGRTHNFKLKGAASVKVTPSDVNPRRLRRTFRSLQAIAPPTPPQREDFLYLQYGELDETVDAGTTGLVRTGNTVVSPAEGTEFDVAVAPQQQIPEVASVVGVGSSTSVDTVVTVVQGSVTVRTPGAPDPSAVTVGTDQQLTVTPQTPPSQNNVNEVDATAVTSWIDVLPPTVVTPVLPDGQVGSSYSQELAARGGQGDYTWTQTSGTLPAGLTLGPHGTISGTATKPGRYTFNVQVSDASGATDSASYTVAITVPHTCGASTSSPCATVWMDKARYKYGETPGMCYDVSEAGHVHIAVTKPDGSALTALDANDDGSGACFSLSVPVGLPAGQRRVHLDLSVDGSVVAGGDTTYTVVPGVCGRVIGQHCTAIWTDKSRYQVGDTAQICYSVPQPIYFQISDVTSDGQSDVVLAGTDDGTGGCVTATVTPPVGSERLQLDVVSSTGARDTFSTSFQVLAAH